MKIWPIVALCVLWSSAEASVLTFDDLPGSGAKIPAAGYGGLTWTGMFYLNGNTYRATPSGYLYGIVSQNNVAYNGYGEMAVASGSVFDFTGAYFTGAWNDGLNVNVKGYNGAVQLYDRTFTVNATGPTWEQLDYLGVTKLEFTSSDGVDHGYVDSFGTQFVMDNFTFQVVPIPPTIWLLGTALAGLGERRWRRRKITR